MTATTHTPGNELVTEPDNGYFRIAEVLDAARHLLHANRDLPMPGYVTAFTGTGGHMAVSYGFGDDRIDIVTTITAWAQRLGHPARFTPIARDNGDEYVSCSVEFTSGDNIHHDLYGRLTPGGGQ